MYDVEKLVSLVCELFDAEAEGKKYNLEVRKNKGYSPDAYLWVSTLAPTFPQNVSRPIIR